jgi:hypothetical protein
MSSSIRLLAVEAEGDSALTREALRQLSLFSPPARLGHTFDPMFDVVRLTNNTARVLKLLLDEEPHTLDELREVGGAQADRRARDLRSERLGAFTVKVYRDPAAPPTSGRWLYQLMNPTEDQVRAALIALGITEPDRVGR